MVGFIVYALNLYGLYYCISWLDHENSLYVFLSAVWIGVNVSFIGLREEECYERGYVGTCKYSIGGAIVAFNKMLDENYGDA